MQTRPGRRLPLTGANFMHIIVSIALFCAGALALLIGLMRVLCDLIERSPHQAPLLEDDGLAWPRRCQDDATEREPPRGEAKRRGYATSPVSHQQTS